jgi:hypothetical protein
MIQTRQIETASRSKRPPETTALIRRSLKSLGLEIHALDEPNSKSRFGNFSKDGLSFLGVRFEGQITYPDSKVVRRFKSKVKAVLKPSSGNSLAKTLQGLANLLKGWAWGIGK